MHSQTSIRVSNIVPEKCLCLVLVLVLTSYRRSTSLLGLLSLWLMPQRWVRSQFMTAISHSRLTSTSTTLTSLTVRMSLRASRSVASVLCTFLIPLHSLYRVLRKKLQVLPLCSTMRMWCLSISSATVRRALWVTRCSAPLSSPLSL